MINIKPLFVDLDGTLIKQDLSHEAFFYFLKKNPIACLGHLFIFLFLGRPYLKAKVSKFFKLESCELNFNQACINYIRTAIHNNRQVYLISGSHQKLVDQINAKLKLFHKVFGTHQNFNMVGKNKIKYINEKLHIFDFDYIGNSSQDLPIWQYTKKAIFTNLSPKIKNKLLTIDIELEEVPSDFK